MMHKTKLERLGRYRPLDEIIDENFVISKGLIKNIVNSKVKFVLSKYGEKVSEKILNDGSYYIIDERGQGKQRKLITLRIKRTDEPLNPKLVLTVETKNGTIQQKELKINTDKLFQQKLDSFPNNEKYKFPKV